jgi:uroporphyrinogen decarboxylase
MSKELTSKERIARTLDHAPIDHIGAYESFWGDTAKKWIGEGHIAEGVSFADHFGHDIRECWNLNLVGDLDFKEEIVEETGETKLVRNGNGAVLRYHKLHSSTPEHVDFLVKDRSGWETHIKPRLLNPADLRRRISFENYRTARKKAADGERFFVWSGLSVFECMHPVCGHENMLVGMALDPDWVRDMCQTYTDLTINLLEILFAEEGAPDGLWFYEDMGFKQKPFMSPQMYDEIVYPSHKRLFDYTHSLGKKVIVHSCGFVEPLVPGLIRAGMDCLQAMEVKAGMDLVRLKKAFGKHIAFMGGMDVRTLVANDRAAIKAELEKKLPTAMEGGGYILYSDHSIPDQVEYGTYKYFLETGLKMGTYAKTKAGPKSRKV